MKHVAEHPSCEQLAAWIDYGLPYGERRDVTAHLAACVTCRDIVCEVQILRAELSVWVAVGEWCARLFQRFAWRRGRA